MKELLNFNDNNVSFIHNGVNTDFFNCNFNIKRNSILFIGKLHEEKGVFELLNAFKNIAKLYKKINLIFIGDGTARTDIENFIQRNSLKNRVKLLGWKKQNQLVEY